MKRKDPNKYPPGLNAAKVRRIIAYYDQMRDEDVAREIKTAPLAEPVSWLPIPQKLVPQVRKLIARYSKN